MRPAACHPDKPHYAHGECRACYMRTNRGRFPSQGPARKRQTPEKMREYRLRSKFGISVEEFDRRLAAQGGVCAVCAGPPGGRWPSYAVDHDHATGEVRGLLCTNCNRALGLLGDDVETLRRMIAYLLPNADEWRKR